jgi:hypothetical protein
VIISSAQSRASGSSPDRSQHRQIVEETQNYSLLLKPHEVSDFPFARCRQDPFRTP